jgi:hypothetical protein
MLVWLLLLSEGARTSHGEVNNTFAALTPIEPNPSYITTHLITLMHLWPLNMQLLTAPSSSSVTSRGRGSGPCQKLSKGYLKAKCQYLALLQLDCAKATNSFEHDNN